MKKILFFLAQITFFANCTNAQSKLAPEAFQKLITTEQQIQIVDVRTPQEVANGYIKNAVNINFNDPNFQANITKLDRTKPVALYCAAGGRSGRAAKILTDLGFQKVYDLEGGMGAWQQKAMPVAKK